MTNTALENIVHKFIAAANKFDTTAVLSLFSDDAVIDDSSVGEKFKGIDGVKKYFITYFIGYNTTTKLIALYHLQSGRIDAKVDFTGDFGRETGCLSVHVNDEGLIDHIEAYLD